MNVASLMHTDVVSCRTHDTLDRAAQLLLEHDIGCLPVLDDAGHVAGMITDRDICMAAYSTGEPLRGIPAARVMTRRVYSCRPTDDLVAVEQTMSIRQIRRMPVIDADGHAIGMISLNDIARASHGGRLAAGDVVATLDAIGAPRPAIVEA